MMDLNLLFTVLFTEMVLILALMFRNPIRNLVISGLDKLKQGKGPLITKTVAMTVLVLFISVLRGALTIQKRSTEGGVVNPTDQVLMAGLLLEASLIGFSLFLAMVTDRLHYYIKKLHLTREDLDKAINKNREDGKSKELEETKQTEDKPLNLNTKEIERRPRFHDSLTNYNMIKRPQSS